MSAEAEGDSGGGAVDHVAASCPTVTGLLTLRGILTPMGSLSPIHWLIILIPIIVVALVVWLIIRLIIRATRTSSTPSAPTRQAQPGWYPDQQNPALVRWHDGHQWTPHTQPRQN